MRSEPTAFAGNKKAPLMAGLFQQALIAPAQNMHALSSDRQRLDASGQAALVASSLVLVDEATRAETIENRLGNVEGSLGAGGVVGIECLEDLLDGGAEHRTLSGVAGIAHDGLLGALLGGLDIGHDRESWELVLKGLGKIRQKIMGDSVACVNNPLLRGRLFLQATREAA
jgi:hypothetical protein